MSMAPGSDTEGVPSSEIRETVLPGLMNRFNGEAWDLLDPWMEVAPIVGVDFYHYENIKLLDYLNAYSF